MQNLRQTFACALVATGVQGSGAGAITVRREKWRMRTGGKTRGLWNSSNGLLECGLAAAGCWEAKRAKKTGNPGLQRFASAWMEAEGTSGGKTEVPFSEKQITARAGVVQDLIDKALARQGTPREGSGPSKDGEVAGPSVGESGRAGDHGARSRAQGFHVMRPP